MAINAYGIGILKGAMNERDICSNQAMSFSGKVKVLLLKLFQQGNAKPHSASITTAWLHSRRVWVLNRCWTWNKKHYSLSLKNDIVNKIGYSKFPNHSTQHTNFFGIGVVTYSMWLKGPPNRWFSHSFPSHFSGGLHLCQLNFNKFTEFKS